MSLLEELPVLILGYNRLDKFTRCISTLNEQGIKKVFVSIDGPKNESDKKIQKEIIKFCEYNKFDLDIRLNRFNRNFGCRIAPVKGITWFFKENEYGVILEDDVLVSKKCIELFYLLLKEYFSNDEIMSISSFNEFTNKNIESLYKLPVWRSWGWASWAEKWKFHLDFSSKISQLSILQLYKLLPQKYRKIETAELIKSCQLNFMDAWDYEFNFSHIVNGKNSLTFGGINNFVYGFDDSATHTFNIENIGIDFDLFRERKIDKTKILKLEKYKIKLTLEKCGFPISQKEIKYLWTKVFFKSIYYSFIFYLRKIKRNIYKNF